MRRFRKARGRTSRRRYGGGRRRMKRRGVRPLRIGYRF